MLASTTLKTERAPARTAGHRHARPLSVRNFMLVALAIVMAGGVTLLVISQASAGEVAGAFVPGALSEGAIGFAALGSLPVSSVVAGFLVLSRRSRHDDETHTGCGMPAA